jgi:hypothetical protein
VLGLLRAESATIAVATINPRLCGRRRPPPKSNTLKIEPVAGGALKHTFDGVNAEGQTTHSERVGKFDGVEIPLQNVVPATTNKTTSALRRLDDRSFEVVSRVNGKVTTTNKVAPPQPERQ